MPKVSVCVPVYNVEKYIEKCVRSLFEQTLEDIEHIFVDDCSQDQSLNILHRVLTEYPQRQNSVKIVRHKCNLNITAARQTAINIASGEYVIMCDSDDWVEPDMYETLYRTAVSNHADIAYCDLMFVVDNIEKHVNQLDTLGGVNAVQQILRANINPGVWIKLVRRSLYQKAVSFSDIRPMYEDTVASINLFYLAKSIIHVPEAYYHYIVHQESVCRTMDSSIMLRRADDIIHNSEKIIQFIANMPSDDRTRLTSDLYGFLFKVKWTLLSWWTMDKDNLSRWRNLWPEIMASLSNIQIPRWKKIVYRGMISRWAAPALQPLLSVYKKTR